MHKSHIPAIETITDFFRIYGLGVPLHPEIMCMRLEDQPDEKLMHMPLSRVNFYRVILFTNADIKEKRKLKLLITAFASATQAN